MVHIPIISNIHNYFNPPEPVTEEPQVEPALPEEEVQLTENDAATPKEVADQPPSNLPIPPHPNASLDHHVLHFVEHSRISLTTKMESYYTTIEERTKKIELADKFIRQIRQARKDDMSCDLSTIAEAKDTMRALKDAGFEIDLSVTKLSREKCDDYIKSLENFSSGEHHHINFDRIKIEQLLNHLNHAYKTGGSHEKNSHSTKTLIARAIANK